MCKQLGLTPKITIGAAEIDCDLGSEELQRGLEAITASWHIITGGVPTLNEQSRSIRHHKPIVTRVTVSN